MAAVLELERQDATPKVNAYVRVSVDGREYLLCHWPLTNGVCVLAGRWIRDRRAFGKLCRSQTEIRRGYKRDGALLADYAAAWGVPEVA